MVKEANNWHDYMDPYYVGPFPGDPDYNQNIPVVAIDSSTEEDPEEDQEISSATYSPASESIPHDAQSEKSIHTPHPYPPRCIPSPYKGKGMMIAARESHTPKTYHLTAGTNNNSTVRPARHVGESSRTQPVPNMTTQLNVLAARVRSLEDTRRSVHSVSRSTRQRVHELGLNEVQHNDALQKLFHYNGANRTDADAQGALIRALEYKVEVIRTRLDTAERRAKEAENELLLLQEQHNEYISYVLTGMGSS